MDTASRPGIFSISNPHSRPPWVASTTPSLPVRSLYAASSVSRNCDSLLYCQPGYTPRSATVPPASAATARTRCASISFRDAMDDRMENAMCSPSPPSFTTPIFRDVCTRPGKSVSIASTPCGMAVSACTSVTVRSADTAFAVSAAAQVSVTSGSVTAYSFFSTPSSSRINASNARPLPLGSATAASQREQITLSNWPPEMAASRRPGNFSSAVASTRPMRRLPLPRPRWMSAPE